MIRRGVAGALATTVVLALGACSGGSEPAPQITSSPGPIPTATATPDPRIAVFDTDNPTARKAYAFAAQVALRYQFNSEYLRLPLTGMVAADVDQLEPVLTSSALTTLKDAVRDAGSSTEAADTVRALTFVDLGAELTGTGLTLRTDPQVVVDQTISRPAYDFLFGYPTVWLTSSGEVLVDGEKGQTTVAYAVRMKMEIHETRDGLRIHAWDSTWAFNGDTPAAVP